MSRIRRALIAGLGHRGSRIAGLVQQKLRTTVGDLPVIRSLSIATKEVTTDDTSQEEVPQADVMRTVLSLPGLSGKGDDSDETCAMYGDAASQLALGLDAELSQITRLDHDRTCARQGWPVATNTGIILHLVADLDECFVQSHLIWMAQQVQELARQRTRQRLSLCSIVLLPPQGLDTERDQRVALVLRALEKEQTIADTQAVLFDEGCYLIATSNEDGLTLGGDADLDDMVSSWLCERLVTPLDLALDRQMPPEESARLGSFGVFGWRFPAQEIIAHLSACLEAEMVACLLAPHRNDLQGHRTLTRVQPPPLWTSGQERFPLAVEQFIPPDLRQIEHLRIEIDRAADNALLRLREAAQDRDAAMREAVQAVTVEVQTGAANVFDRSDGGLQAGIAYLRRTIKDLEGQAQDAAERAACARKRATDLAKTRTEAGSALDGELARFPAWQWDAWLRLLILPWRLVSLPFVYRGIGVRVTAYLAAHQACWQARAEALEADWQSAFYSASAETAREWLRRAEQFRRGIAVLSQDLPPRSYADERELDDLLQANALPRGLAGYYYRKVAGPDRGGARRVLEAFAAVYGPLSRWLDEELSVQELADMLGEHAAEKFSFVADQARLDELLVQTYTRRELKGHLWELLAASRPFWDSEQAFLTADERSRSVVRTFVGLPSGESMLGELVGEVCPGANLYANPNPRCITAVQVRYGLSLEGRV